MVENAVERERQLPWPKKRGEQRAESVEDSCITCWTILLHLVATQPLSGISPRKACAKVCNLCIPVIPCVSDL